MTATEGSERRGERHDCPKAGCPHTLPFHKFACQAHWFVLPPEVRARVSGTWRSGDLVAYMEARAEAVAVLNAESVLP